MCCSSSGTVSTTIAPTSMPQTTTTTTGASSSGTVSTTIAPTTTAKSSQKLGYAEDELDAAARHVSRGVFSFKFLTLLLAACFCV